MNKIARSVPILTETVVEISTFSKIGSRLSRGRGGEGDDREAKKSDGLEVEIHGRAALI